MEVASRWVGLGRQDFQDTGGYSSLCVYDDDLRSRDARWPTDASSQETRRPVGVCEGVTDYLGRNLQLVPSSGFTE
jgi:hypothetical protein